LSDPNGEKLAPLIAEIEAASGRAVDRSLVARKEDDIAAFVREDGAIAPLRFASLSSANTGDATSCCS
jgi:hypothetical protein